MGHYAVPGEGLRGESFARRRLRGYAAYGTAYGLAWLGCALPVFLPRRASRH